MVNFCLEMASAMGLVMPGMCFKVTVQFPFAEVRKSRRRRHMVRGCLDDFPSHAWTMGRLSKKNLIFSMDHKCPQVRTAVMMAKSSCHWIEMCLDSG